MIIQIFFGCLMIKIFFILVGMQLIINYNMGGEVFGWGFCNIVGLIEDFVYGGIWFVENQMDDF